MKKIDEIDEVILLVLYFIKCIYGRTYLQKFFFLMDREKKINYDLNFIKYHYGPFSRELRDRLKFLVKEKLIKESINITQGNIGHCYQLTDSSKIHIKDIIKNKNKKFVKELETFCRKYEHYSPSELLRLVYSKYPEWAINSVLND